MRSVVIAVGLAAGCDAADVEPPPVWTPIDMIEGRLQAEVSVPRNPAAPRGNMRVVTYNTRHGVDVEFAPYFIAHPDLASADVLLLQENERGPNQASDAGKLAAALDMGHVYAPIGELDAGGTYGLAILSRFIVRDIEVLVLQELQGIEVNAVRAALAVVIDTPNGPLRVVNVHLDFALNISERILQLRPAVFDAPATVVVGGDLNTNDYVWTRSVPIFPLDAAADTAQAPEIDEYVRLLGYETPTARFGNTWSGFPEDQRLDAIFTRGVVAGAGAVDRGIDLSDHWPIWLDIEVR